MSYRMNGVCDGYDLTGEGTCLTTVLISYAEDCRKSAKNYQELAKFVPGAQV